VSKRLKKGEVESRKLVVRRITGIKNFKKSSRKESRGSPSTGLPLISDFKFMPF